MRRSIAASVEACRGRSIAVSIDVVEARRVVMADKGPPRLSSTRRSTAASVGARRVIIADEAPPRLLKHAS